MNLLNPAWLWGLLALAIPIIVHLFNFRKTRRIYFSNTKFIKKVQEASKSRRKLKHYLILLSRMLFIFWLVMCFAQPFIPAEEGSLQKDKVYFYLDNSYSMSSISGNQITAFEEGIEYIEKLVPLYPAGTDFYLLTNDFAPYSHSPRSARQLLELLTEIKQTGVIRSMDEVIRRWKSQQMIEGEGDNYFISDFQKSTIKHSQSGDSLINLKLIPVKLENNTNVFIDSAFIDNPFLIGKERVKLHVTITNDGKENVADVPVTIFLDDTQVASTTTEINAHNSKTLDFDLMVNNNTSGVGRISIEEYPVTFDNDLFFVMNLGERIRIVEVKAGVKATPVSRVYGNEELFSFSSYNFENLDYNALERADLVVVNGLNSINSSFGNALQKYIRQGGNIMFIPGAKPDISTYSGIFNGLSLRDTSYQMKLATPDFNNPFFEQVFEDKDPAIDMPQAAPLLNMRGVNSLLSFRNGNNFLSYDNREAFLLATPLTDDFTDFHKHALFVPVMYKIAALSTNNSTPLYHYIDEHLISIPVDSVPADEVFKMTNAGEELIPAQRLINNQLQLELPGHVVNKGYYDVAADGRTIQTLAFNTNKVESKLMALSIEDINNLKMNYPNIMVYDVDDVDQFGKTIHDQYIGWSLWKYCLILAILFLLAEILIIRFIK